MRGALICIDAGHGGADTGALENGVAEKDVNLDIALRARRMLEQKGYRVVMTRETDTAVSLARRCEIANGSDPEILVSIHNNSRPPDAQGTTTYYYSESPQGRLLASFIQSQVAARIRRPDRGLRGSRLYMVRNVDMPSALLEGVFLSNEEDAALIKDADFRQQIADGVVAGIDAYMKNK
ncbi:MAG: N-acetylmuramoyl-L-alanine amidase family protein, partial [Candidatus Geothermincolia bacterium]